MSTPAGWHPDPEYPGQLRYWDGTRWTDSRTPAQQAAPTQPPRPKKTGKIIAAIVIGLIIVGFGGCAACVAIVGSSSDENNTVSQSQDTPAETAQATPAETAEAVPETPEVPGIGDTVVVDGGNGQVVEVTLVSKPKIVKDPPFIYPTDSGGGWAYAVVHFKFKNTGDKYYKGKVAMWSTLFCNKNNEDKVDGEYLTVMDSQGDNGEMQLDPGNKKDWFVAFRVRKIAEPTRLEWEGPNSELAIWDW